MIAFITTRTISTTTSCSLNENPISPIHDVVEGVFVEFIALIKE
jgi:hypothetical protein